MSNPTRQQMVEDLTNYELKYFLNNKELLSELTMFFSENGFNSYDENALIKAWNEKFKD
jgi:hypothetical protein